MPEMVQVRETRMVGRARVDVTVTYRANEERFRRAEEMAAQFVLANLTDGKRDRN
jgi:hypothetical protein